eukprot:jgi/Mesvir1/26811/Mv20574-RA.1
MLCVAQLACFFIETGDALRKECSCSEYVARVHSAWLAPPRGPETSVSAGSGIERIKARKLAVANFVNAKAGTLGMGKNGGWRSVAAALERLQALSASAKLQRPEVGRHPGCAAQGIHDANARAGERAQGQASMQGGMGHACGFRRQRC